MYNDYNESTRRFRNLGRIVDFWDQQGKVLQGERSCCNFWWQQVCYGLLGQPEGKNACMFASVVGDVVAYGRKQQKVEVLVISLIKEA
jgi:hypothetical protein